MAVRIGSNISSLTAQRRLGEATSSLEKTYERLSSGLRINRASDDAAGLAIASTLNAKARIFTQAVRNLNDGISFTSIAGGALKELKSVLLRQRELATQSSNGTYSDRQREVMDAELAELSAEWNRVLDSTVFNGRKIFSAKEGSLTLQAGIGIEAVLHVNFGSLEALAQDDTVRVSVLSDGTELNGDSDTKPSLSADGRYVVFSSAATNLGAVDSNVGYDVFVRDLVTGETQIVSSASSGEAGNRDSYGGSISADGRYVLFASDASDLVSNDGNGSAADIFIRDLVTGETRLVSTSSAEEAGDSGSQNASFSSDGRYVTFTSASTNLVADDNNNKNDIFIKDLETGETRRVSTSSSELEANADCSGPAISADGRYVTFASSASNLDGSATNGKQNIFIKDTLTGELRLVSEFSGNEGDDHSNSPSISADGRFVAFQSSASNLAAGSSGAGDIFVKDLLTGEVKLVSGGLSGPGSGASYFPVLSADGRYVTFASSASNLVDGDTNGRDDIFVKDLVSGELRRVSTDSSGGQGNDFSLSPAMSADGRYVGFYSSATNLAAGDSGTYIDAFVIGNPFTEWSTVSRSQWLSVATRSEALLSQDRLDNYLEELNVVEGSLGAVEARLGAALGNLQTMTENFRAAESRIVNADIGLEAAELTRSQIVQSAAAAILAQANQQPQIALSLLRNT